MNGVLFRLEDRRERQMVLGPTHEEVVTTLVRQNVRSYRDLPITAYQVQTKFRDEARPRAGLIRGREFLMKDAYSFHADEASLDATYEAMKTAYTNVFARCGLPSVMVEADSGAIGGKASHEFMLLADSGEDEVLLCSHCGYAANAEKAGFVKTPGPQEAARDLGEVHTPGKRTIADVAGFLGIGADQTLKALFYIADGELVFVTIRGDLEVNEVKLKNTLKATDLRLANDQEVSRARLVAGSASAVGLEEFKHVADDSITLGSNFVAGANKPDYHLLNVNYPRDFRADTVTDISLARPGHTCAACNHGDLAARRGIEVGHIFKLGIGYSETLGALFTDAEGQERPIIMGCYGIGVSRVLAAAVEQNHDDKGILWPRAIAPFQVHLVGLNMDNPEVGPRAWDLYRALQHAGIDALFDDRVESAGVKFNDADLLGIPLRVTVSPRTLAKDGVELKGRQEKDAALVPLPEVVDRLRALLA
jgi:prolyl-tRNA synthetase